MEAYEAFILAQLVDEHYVGKTRFKVEWHDSEGEEHETWGSSAESALDQAVADWAHQQKTIVDSYKGER